VDAKKSVFLFFFWPITKSFLTKSVIEIVENNITGTNEKK